MSWYRNCNSGNCWFYITVKSSTSCVTLTASLNNVRTMTIAPTDMSSGWSQSCMLGWPDLLLLLRRAGLTACLVLLASKSTSGELTQNTSWPKHRQYTGGDPQRKNNSCVGLQMHIIVVCVRVWPVRPVCVWMFGCGLHTASIVFFEGVQPWQSTKTANHFSYWSPAAEHDVCLQCTVKTKRQTACGTATFTTTETATWWLLGGGDGSDVRPLF